MVDLGENLKSRRRTFLLLRVDYVATLLMIVSICVWFYSEQNTQNRTISHLSLMIRELGKLDDTLAALAVRAEQVGELPDNAGIESVKKGLLFRQAAIAEEFRHFGDLW